MTIIFITGGIRSGKSDFAEKYASASGSSILYIATGVNFDEEMNSRIKLHQDRRPGNWGLYESPLQLIDSSRMSASYDVFLFDCLSSWVSNRLLQVPEEQGRDQMVTDQILSELDHWLEAISSLSKTIIIVSNEVGLGGVAMSRLGRCFQDVLGEANQRVAKTADEVYAVISGIPWRIK